MTGDGHGLVEASKLLLYRESARTAEANRELLYEMPTNIYNKLEKLDKLGKLLYFHFPLC